MSLARLNELFAGVAAELNFTGTLLDENGACTITLRGGLPPVHLAYDAGSDLLDILSEIGYVPDDDSALYKELLMDNLYGEDMRFSVYAVNPDNGRVVLKCTVPVGCLADAKALADLLCAFVENIRRGRKRLYRKAQSAQEAETLEEMDAIRV